MIWQFAYICLCKLFEKRNVCTMTWVQMINNLKCAVGPSTLIDDLKNEKKYVKKDSWWGDEGLNQTYQWKKQFRKDSWKVKVLTIKESYFLLVNLNLLESNTKYVGEISIMGYHYRNNICRKKWKKGAHFS